MILLLVSAFVIFIIYFLQRVHTKLCVGNQQLNLILGSVSVHVDWNDGFTLIIKAESPLVHERSYKGRKTRMNPKISPLVGGSNKKQVKRKGTDDDILVNKMQGLYVRM